MSASTPSAEPDRYVAEYLDGPLGGTAEHRYLIDGQPEQRLTQVALVDGTEALFDYVAGESRELNGERYVQFRFDPNDSDMLQGQADQNEESRHI
ncbi:MAG TPA: hypothetical protein VGO26_04135 [Amnibacterium sp.]|jgi:hypothetical protein|nr:hypothetical protein [Amnibacterium sp.]